jgi:hypothetical protein
MTGTAEIIAARVNVFEAARRRSGGWGAERAPHFAAADEGRFPGERPAVE